MALTNKLTAIADGFRTSRGTTDKYTLDQMAVLAAEPIGGGGGEELPEEAFNISGDCSYRFKNNWDWFLDMYGNKVTTTGITTLSNAFNGSTVKVLPFTLNVNNTSDFSSCFANMFNLKETPKIRGSINMGTSFNAETIINSCYRLRDVEDLFEPSMLDAYSTIKVTSAYSSPKSTRFPDCRSLRRVPSWFYKYKLSPESTVYPSYSSTLYYNCFSSCYSLDEVLNIPVWTCQGASPTSNMFNNTFRSNYRVKEVTFETDNGQPIVTKWQRQTIDLSGQFGYSTVSINSIVDYNSGITSDKLVKNDDTYQALKNDPDWFTTKTEYSRYNHDSAVNTINSLPDTSEFLATTSYTNTIKFSGSSGSKTDGGAINTLTAEEIAVAAAKGWTVTLS